MFNAATRAVAEGDFSVRVPARKNPRDLAECIGASTR